MNQDFPGAGMELTHILVVHDLDHARTFYRDVLGASVYRSTVAPRVSCSRGSWAPAGHRRGPTADKLAVTFEPRATAERVSPCLTIRRPRLPGSVCPAERGRGAVSLTPPYDWGREIRCFFRDPDGTYSRSVKRGSGIAQRTPTDGRHGGGCDPNS